MPQRKRLTMYTAVLRHVETGDVLIQSSYAHTIDGFCQAMNNLGYVIVDEKVKRTADFVNLILTEIPDAKWHPKKIRLDFTEVEEPTDEVGTETEEEEPSKL